MAIPRRPLAAGLHAAAYMVAFAAVVSLAAASWSAPADPVLVKGDPSVLEGVSTAHGAWIGWVQSSSTSTSHDNFFVQRGGQAPVRVNAARTSGLGGGIAGHGVFYVQQFGDRRPQLIRYDLRTGDRAPLPAKVNHYRHYAHVSCCGGQPSRSHVLSGVRGHATVSGP